jgi:tRNA dimethylallyltransferase
LKKFLLVIAGPTASGKTDLAITLAGHYQTEIVSADSRQFFIEMEKGTAKPDPSQLNSIPHHFINSHSITQSYNAGMYETECDYLLEQLFKKHNLLILTGGSGLYIDAVLNGMDALPAADKNIRQQLQHELDANGISSLREKLNALDPLSANEIDLDNPRRIMRALEICMITGKPYTQLLKKKKKAVSYGVIYIGTDIPRPVLYERINQRVDKMMSAGLKKEVEQLMPYKDQPAMQTVGYKELVEFHEGKCTESEAVDKIKQHTRNYAKRQMTWFRKNKSIHWVDPSDVTGIINYIDGIIAGR